MDRIYIAPNPVDGEPFISTPDPTVSQPILIDDDDVFEAAAATPPPQQASSTIDSFLWTQILQRDPYEPTPALLTPRKIENVTEEYERSERTLSFEDL